MYGEQRNVKSTIALSNYFNLPGFTESNFDDLTRGMVSQGSQSADTNYDAQVREFFLKNTNTFGADLRALDIQRARDHGMPRYNFVRQFCGFNVFGSFSEFATAFSLSATTLNNLQLMYETVNDIEFSVGAMLETNVAKTLAGPTLLCIMNKQFLNSRVGDRYWFESGDPEVAFTADQLAEIRKSTFARLICDNSNNVQTIQPFAFRLPNLVE